MIQNLARLKSEHSVFRKKNYIYSEYTVVMKINRLIICLSILMLSSCLNKPTSENDKISKTLNDESLSINVLSKRPYDDLVEKLYEDLIKHTPELNDLEIKINAIKESETDSTKKFENYNGKNLRYYGNAQGISGGIKDSILRERVKLMISKSESKYKESTLKQIGLLKEIEAKKTSLNDLHVILKIIKTLPLIEKYQASSKPSDHSLNGYIKEINKGIILADTLTKKAGFVPNKKGQ